MNTPFPSILSDPALLASLQNTLTPAGLLTQMQALQEQQGKELSDRAAQASQAATAAGARYQQAAAAPPPQLSPLEQGLPTLAGGIADAITGGHAATDRATQGKATQQHDLMAARVQNLDALKNVYDVKATAAQRAGDLETTEKYRSLSEKMAALGHKILQEQKIQADKDAAEQNQKYALERIDRTASQQRQTQAAPGSSGGDDGQAADLANAIYERRADPNLGNRITKESKAVRSALYRLHPDFNLATAVSDWNNKENFNRTENSQRFVLARTAIQTFAEHLSDYEQFNREFDGAYKRSKARFLNLGIMTAAKNGLLGPKAAEAAAALETNRGPLADEFATILSGGYAPQKNQLDDAHRSISLLWSPGQQSRSIETLKKLVRGRTKSMNRQVPHSGSGTNPYLQDVTPVDPFPETPSGTQGSAGVERYDAQGNRIGGN